LKVRNISPLGALDLPGVGLVDAGAVIEVPADGEPGTVFAGRPPAARLAAAHLELHAAISALDHPGAAALREEIIGLDPGAGLLAQAGTWEPVTVKKAAAGGEEAQP
jgi:hypothetical protein